VPRHRSITADSVHFSLSIVLRTDLLCAGGSPVSTGLHDGDSFLHAVEPLEADGAAAVGPAANRASTRTLIASSAVDCF
jgi:hypothetical protein